MKLIAVVVLCVVFAAVKAGIGKETILSLSAGCAEETGATEADIEVLMDHMPAQNMKTKCLRACMMKKLDVMNADGKFQADVALKLAEAHTHGDAKAMQIAKAVTGTCKDVAVPDDHCEAAEAYDTCLRSEAVKHGVNLRD